MRLILAVLALIVVTNANPIYSVVDLGPINNWNVVGINASGTVVGTGEDIYNNLYAFVGNTSNIFATTMASGINNSGEIVGTSIVNGQVYATTWTNGVAQIIGPTGSYGTAINNLGQISTNAHGINDSGVTAGTNYISGVANAYRGSTTLPNLAGSSYGNGINAGGTVVGSSVSTSGYMHAVIWSTLGITDLGTLGGNSYGYGINDSGVAVGYSYLAGGDEHGFVYTSGMMTDLNYLTLTPGWTVAEAYGINNNGQIAGVGYYNGVQHIIELNPMNTVGCTPVASPEPNTGLLILLGIVAWMTFRLLKNNLNISKF